jgi:hypothetical protein
VVTAATPSLLAATDDQRPARWLVVALAWQSVVWFGIATCDCSYFNHHYQLFSMMAALLALGWAVRDARRDETVVPRWYILLLQGTISLVYAGGAYSKLVNPDWMDASVPRIWLESKAAGTSKVDMPWWIARFFGVLHPYEPEFMAWSGLVLDGIAPFALLSSNVLARSGILVSLAAFHIMNAHLWSIGTFPHVMLGTSVAFVTSWRSATAPYQPRNLKPALPYPTVSPAKRWSITIALLTFLIVQFALPTRHQTLHGLADESQQWTRRHHFFSWRMMLNDEDALWRTVAWDCDRVPVLPADACAAAAGDGSLARPLPGLITMWPQATVPMTKRQAKRGIVEPSAIGQHLLKTRAASTKGGITDVCYVAEVWRSLNGRPYVPWFNLTSQTTGPPLLHPTDMRDHMTPYPGHLSTRLRYPVRPTFVFALPPCGTWAPLVDPACGRPGLALQPEENVTSLVLWVDGERHSLSADKALRIPTLDVGPVYVANEDRDHWATFLVHFDPRRGARESFMRCANFYHHA